MCMSGYLPIIMLFSWLTNPLEVEFLGAIPNIPHISFSSDSLE